MICYILCVVIVQLLPGAIFIFSQTEMSMPLNLSMCIEERQRMYATVSHSDSEPTTKVRELYSNVSRTTIKESVR